MLNLEKHQKMIKKKTDVVTPEGLVLPCTQFRFEGVDFCAELSKKVLMKASRLLGVDRNSLIHRILDMPFDHGCYIRRQ